MKENRGWFAIGMCYTSMQDLMKIKLSKFSWTAAPMGLSAKRMEFPKGALQTLNEVKDGNI